MIKAVSSLSLALEILLAISPPAQAQWSSWDIKTGFGDEIQIKNGLFGTKTRVVKDRLGDKYVDKKGLLGGTEKEVSVLGNGVKQKKSFFGSKETEAHTLLGDSIKTKKSWFLGRRTTTVDASGIAGLIGTAIKSHSNNGVMPWKPGSQPSPLSTFGSNASSGGLMPANDPGVSNSSAPAPQELDAQAQPMYPPPDSAIEGQ